MFKRIDSIDEAPDVALAACWQQWLGFCGEREAFLDGFRIVLTKSSDWAINRL